MKLSPRLRCRAGFSLVEVMIATGIITFSVVAVLGVLPVGLTTLRQSMEQTVESQIIRGLAAQSVLSEFSTLSQQTNFYYDEEGQALPRSMTNDAYYVARVSPQVPVFPQSGQSSTITNSLTSLRVELVAQPNPSAPSAPKIFALKVANSGN